MNKFLENTGIEIDEFGRPSGILLVNKEVGETSHDVVDKVRKIYGTRKVGHAGTLDPFAEGLLIILVGKATKLSNELLNKDKEYQAEVLFGISTNTSDIEGTIDKSSEKEINKEDLVNTLKKFQPNYNQYVPVFSSVKVDGDKLRVLARKYESFEITKNKQVIFKGPNSEKEVTLPSKVVNIHTLTLDSFSQVNSDKLLEQLSIYKESLSDSVEQYISEFEGSFQLAQITVSCSKGTYIRQLARDIGEELGSAAMLRSLKRTKVGPWSLLEAKTINELQADK
ncbi:tRNA pseudouridine(55) synthase TruB [Candidatus Dojkabacteria bacterium]|uniref:tRNA pseudouridine synthase B n=1 Tax=Candidatus Dojkabacteria bacterium TaxID=2099670 RepID=A0A955RGS0_9BACT|nr:tRNA pseudouridine(55) synthase TruB [Candidatus Dojkabacteria bacterium]